MRGAVLLVAVVAALALAGCRPSGGAEGKDPTDPLAVAQTNPFVEISKNCTRTGGRMVTIGKGQVCVHDTKDVGKTCRRATDCEGDCLARSGTCAPARPLFGCNEILMNEGQRAMLCRD